MTGITTMSTSAWLATRAVGTTVQATRAAGGVSAASAVRSTSRPASAAAAIASIRASGDLAQVHAALELPTRTSNALATADHTLAAMGELLSSARAAVQQASSAGGNGQISAAQGTVDATVSRVDLLAARTTFAGRALLDGSYTATVSGASLALPSMRSSQLRSSGDAPAPATLASIASGGVNDLSHGTAVAAGVVAEVIRTVSDTRERIAEFRRNAIAPQLSAACDALDDLAGSADATADVGKTAALLVRAQLVTQPQAVIATAATAQPQQPQNVLWLLSPVTSGTVSTETGAGEADKCSQE